MFWFILALITLSGCRSNRTITETVTFRDTSVVVPESNVLAKLELKSFSLDEIKSDSFRFEGNKRSRFVFIPDTAIEVNADGLSVRLRADSGKITALATKEKQEIRFQIKEVERLIYVEKEPETPNSIRILRYALFILGLSVLMILILKLM